MNLFWETEEVKEGFDFEQSKSDLIENLDYLHSMSVEEHTLYKKWKELQDPNIIKNKSLISYFYDSQWKPTDINNKELTIKEINELEPYVEIVGDNSKDIAKWTYLRKMIHTMSWVANPGRNVKISVRDRKTNKLLGLISLGSDVTSIKVRDDYIGWTQDDKFKNGKLNNTTIATSIVSTQPLGYNFLGGKLVSMMCTVPEVREYWEKKYKNKLIAVNTTSLYGVHSQYNGIPHYKTLGETAGKISIKPDDDVYEPWHHYVKEKYPEWYQAEIMSNKSSPKQRILNKIFKECGIKLTDYHHGYKRGVYIAQMYDNGNEFLCSKIDEKDLKMKQKFEEGVDYISRWWKKKAINRYTKLYDTGRLKPEHLYYVEGIGITWESFKEKYLSEVGR